MCEGASQVSGRTGYPVEPLQYTRPVAISVRASLRSAAHAADASGIIVRVPLKSIRAWLGVDSPDTHEFAPLRETLQALDHLEPERARYLAAFAYLLGRVAHADQDVSAEETRAMEALVLEQGQLSQDQAMLVVQLAKTSNLLFGGTANFLVAREFSNMASYDQKLALMRCLFALSATDEAISTAEESEIHRIANELRIDHPDLVALRVAHRRNLPGMSR